MATSKGKIHAVFFNNVTALAQQARALADGLTGVGLRVWQMPSVPVPGAPLADTLDVAGATPSFNRDQIDQNYEVALGSGTDPGTVGDVVSLKTQGDYVAVMERGFRARHASPVRCLVHAAVRRNGHAHPQGPLLGGVVKYAQDANAQG